MHIRPYRSSDCPALAELFYQTVHAVNARDYSPEQLDAWADGRVELAAWDASFRAHDTRVAVEGTADGHARFTATIEFSPTLFGLGLKSSVLGVALPRLEHAVSLTVDPYKPGMLL